MKFLLINLFALFVASNAFSLKGKGMSIADSKMLTQKEVTRMTTRRDTIMMPSQTPMVPWKVSFYVVFQNLLFLGNISSPHKIIL
jgi:nitrate reductase cytochrome c-type subunit